MVNDSERGAHLARELEDAGASDEFEELVEVGWSRREVRVFFEHLSNLGRLRQAKPDLWVEIVVLWHHEGLFLKVAADGMVDDDADDGGLDRSHSLHDEPALHFGKRLDELVGKVARAVHAFDELELARRGREYEA